MRKRRKRRINLGNLLVLFILLLAMVFGYLFLSYKAALKPVSKTSEEVVFSVNSGDSSKTVIKNLVDQGIIKEENYSLFFVKQNKLTNIKAGNYTIDKSWDVSTIFKYINNASNAISDDQKITIIEGDWAKDIARKVNTVLGIDANELMELWNDETYIRSLMNDYPFITEEIFNSDIRVKLEGFLFPETYLLAKDSTKEAVTKKLLDQTLKTYNQYEAEMKKHNLSIHELFTLASIVQYEASTTEDMKIIAGVFFNRMDIGMKLQSSVTVCYAIDKEKEDDWTKCEVNPDFDSPYNTYKYAGLPPGPILNPGKAAIDAVLNPTASKYLYFMADVYGDGKVYYAETYEEHSANVRKYLR